MEVSIKTTDSFVDILDNPNAKRYMLELDSCYWAVNNGLNLLGGEKFNLAGCVYLADIMQSEAAIKVVMKCAQARITTVFMVDAIHGLIYGHYPQGVIYYFPTEKSVEGFSKTRFGPLVADNACIKRYMKDTNSVSIKRVGKTFLSLLGAKSTQLIQNDKKDGTSVRSTPADYIIRDERDLFDEDMAEQTKQRILNSKIKKEVDLGTPTIPDWGISRCFNESDQRFRHIKCSHCGGWTCLTLEFPNCVTYSGTDSLPYLSCIKCGRPFASGEIDLNGQWVSSSTGNNGNIAGWQIPHLITPNCDLSSVMRRWEICQKDTSKLGEFYNSILGLPYIAAEDRLRMSDVLACCGDDLMAGRNDFVGTAMGVDIQGSKKGHHVVIAKKIDKKRAKIIYMGRVSGFPALHDLGQRFNVKSAMLDLRPYEEEFRNFQKSEKYKVFGAEYRDRMKGFERLDEKQGVYAIARTEIFDKTHALIINKQIELPRLCDEVKEFARQCCNTAKKLIETEQGDRIYRYLSLGDFDYRNALNYLWFALENLNEYESGNFTEGMKRQEDSDDYNPLTFGLN